MLPESAPASAPAAASAAAPATASPSAPAASSIVVNAPSLFSVASTGGNVASLDAQVPIIHENVTNNRGKENRYLGEKTVMAMSGLKI